MLKKVKGKVIRGNGIGRKQGYPTALLDVAWEGEMGVFGAKVEVEGGRSEIGLLIVGVEQGPSVELHILDFEGDLYGQTVEVEVGKKTREIRRFASDDDLKKQIEEDITSVRKNF